MMTPNASKPAWSWLLAAGLLILLLILAGFQFRWLEEVRRADRDKTRNLLQAAVERFAEDFDRELTRAFLLFQPRAASRDLESFAARYERWQTYAPFPELVRDLYMARRGDDGALETTRFGPAEGAFAPAAWPAELEQLHQRLAAERRWPRRGEPRDGAAGLQLLADEVPALILPLSGGRPPGGRPLGGGPPPPAAGRGFVVVHLDLNVIRDVILPRLSEQHLHGGDGIVARDGRHRNVARDGRQRTEYDARVWALKDQRIIFFRGAQPEKGRPRDGDAGAGLFGLLPPERLETLELEAGLVGPDARHPYRRDEPEAGAPRLARGPRFGEGQFHNRLYRFVSAQENARWRLEVSHPAGSLDAAVARAHRRNLAISFGILLLLGASLMLILGSTRRQQELARQQLEFVAGVSHELLTPLAAMRSAGQNLADGVVSGPDQVRRYGRLVDDEGRRLSNMVGQVLEFARMRAGRTTYTLERTALAPLVEGALAEYAPVLEEKGVQVETRFDSDLPDVMADASALRRAVQNLIANAIKYGEAGSWIGLSAVAAEGARGPELQLSVEDRGSGIAAVDLPRLFEPFYRGRNGSAEAIPGSGLGLSLVKHIVEGHGGRVAVETKDGEGSTFTLHLPAAAGDAPEAT